MSLISQLLPLSNVVVDLDASSKKRVFEQAGLLFENNQGIARSTVFDSLFTRERLGSTGLGQGIAIPHGRIKALKDAGRDTDRVAALMGNNAAHVIGMDTKNSFNGTWGTDATWHKIFYKDIKAHEMFSGVFEAEKLIKFHENPVPEKEKVPCDGIDC